MDGIKGQNVNYFFFGCINFLQQEIRVVENDKDYVLENLFYFYSVKLIC